jgi:hypothetical protein
VTINVLHSRSLRAYLAKEKKKTGAKKKMALRVCLSFTLSSHRQHPSSSLNQPAVADASRQT